MMARIVLDLAVFATILLLALVRLAEPFFADQALNLLMGRIIAAGGTPYVDLWDPKYPGIFLFFAAGGGLFGFDEIGIHLFELFWMLGLALAVRLVAGRYLGRAPVASLAPAFTVGAYYAGTTNYHLTQTEAVIGLPLLLSLATLALAVRSAGRRTAVWLFISGASAGIALVFSIPYGILALLFWLVTLHLCGRGDSTLVRKMVPPLFLGAMVPVSVAAIYLSSKPGLEIVWWTFVEYPREASTECPIVLQRWVDSSVWFLRTFRVPLVLAAIGAWHRVRRGADLLTVGLLVWIIAGGFVITTQVLAWWAYQFLLLSVPVGLLATQGLQTLWLAMTESARPRYVRALALTVLLVLGGLYARQLSPVVSGVWAALGSPLIPDRAAITAYQASRYPGYADELAAVSFLQDPKSHGGAIYVFAMPNLYHVAHRQPAIPLLAAWFRPTTELWNRLLTELEAAAPPYILVNDHELAFIVYQNPRLEGEVSQLRSRLEKRYDELHTSVQGTWYVRSDLAARSN